MFHRAIWRQQLWAVAFFYAWIPLLVLGPGPLLDRLLGTGPWPCTAALALPAAPLAAIGVALMGLSVRDLRVRGRGTPSPAMPAITLVTGGVYGLCRHPMHLGYDLLLLAGLLLLGTPAGLLLAYPLFLAWTIRHLRREEMVLARRFPRDFPAYRARVPFLVPGWRPGP